MSSKQICTTSTEDKTLVPKNAECRLGVSRIGKKKISGWLGKSYVWWFERCLSVCFAYRACGKYAVIRMSVEREKSMYNKWTRVSVTGSVKKSQLDFTAVVLFEKTNLFHMADLVDIAIVHRTF